MSLLYGDKNGLTMHEVHNICSYKVQISRDGIFRHTVNILWRPKEACRLVKDVTQLGPFRPREFLELHTRCKAVLVSSN